MGLRVEPCGGPTGGRSPFGRCSQVVSRDVSHRHGLPSRQRREPRHVRQSTCCGIGGEGGSMSVAHPRLAPDPRTTNLDGFPGSGLAWLLLLEERRHALGTDGGPLRQQCMVLVRQRPAATNSDQSGVTLFGEDRHRPILPADPLSGTRTARGMSGRA